MKPPGVSRTRGKGPGKYDEGDWERQPDSGGQRGPGPYCRCRGVAGTFGVQRFIKAREGAKVAVVE